MIGYALFYFIRKNLAVALPSIEADLGISKVQLGVFLTLHGLLYGFSRLFNGMWADRTSARVFMVAALCGLVLFLSIWNAASDGYGEGKGR